MTQLIRELLREQGAAAEDRVALESARHELSRSVGELMVSRKQSARRRGAALRGFSSSVPDGPATSVTKLTKGRPMVKPKTPAPLGEQEDSPPLPLATFQLKRRSAGQP